MKKLMLKLERLIPFLSVPRLAIPDRRSKGRQRGTAERLKPGAELCSSDIRATTVTERSLEGSGFYRVVMERVSFEKADLSDTTFAHCGLYECRFAECSLPRTRWTVVAADGTSFSSCSLPEAEWVGVSFREAAFEQVVLSGARVQLCDGFAVRMDTVDATGAVFRSTDLSYADLHDVDFSDADLRGARFAHSTWRGVTLDGARVEDADFRGVRGLSREVRVDLARRGAVVWSGWVESTAWSFLTRRRPGWSADRVDRLARGVGWAGRGLVLLGVLLVVGVLARAGWTAPQEHGTAGRSADQTAWQKRTATQEEIARTRENLERLREAIQRAYRTTARYGVARYPTGAEVAGNQFDQDGDGPGTEMVTLVPGGLPMNFLTDGEGVAPYCNEVPTQDTLSGDDTDWHYCETTGRVFACGGYTDVPTIEW